MLKFMRTFLPISAAQQRRITYKHKTRFFFLINEKTIRNGVFFSLKVLPSQIDHNLIDKWRRILGLTKQKGKKYILGCIFALLFS
ncbi:hypothetical protein HanIR_Chr03g0123711 [Helianthus annuus]|nr:hypothetical protein HanIR_Chr03g0123711 [Helianthus annuus]